MYNVNGATESLPGYYEDVSTLITHIQCFDISITLNFFFFNGIDTSCEAGVSESTLGKYSSQALGLNRMEWERTSHQTCVESFYRELSTQTHTLSHPYTHTCRLCERPRAAPHFICQLSGRRAVNQSAVSLQYENIGSPFITAIIKVQVI